MGRIIGYVILAVCVFVAWEGYQNSRVDPATEQLSKGEACGGIAACVVKREQPTKVITDVLRRRYEWRTSEGTRVVTCTRTYLWLGDWGCVSEPGHL